VARGLWFSSVKRRPSRSRFATYRAGGAGRNSTSGFASARRARQLLLPPRAEVRWRWRSRRVTCWVGGAQATRDAKLSSRSRGAGGIRGEEVLDRRELPDTFGRPGRALIVELILVRLTILGVSFGRPKTYVALRRQTRKLPGESRMLSGGAGEIHQFFSQSQRTPAAGMQRRALLARVQVGLSLFGNRGLGPYSRIAGHLHFPLRPSRGNCLSAPTGFRFQWRRNRFACRDVLLWCFSGRPIWRSR
jgi:hypothetical protein